MFALEKDMTPIVTNNAIRLTQITNSLKSAVALELPVKYRMIDIAIAYELPDNLNNTTDLKPFKYLNGCGIGILSLFVSYPKVSLQKMRSELLLEIDVLEKYIQKFLRNNLIIQISKQTYAATEWKFHYNNLGLISIELKLNNWKEALEQAEFNLQFSDFSFVALDKSRIINSKEMLPFFKEKNIGLLSVSCEGTVETLFTPKKNRKFNRQLYVSQRIKLMQDLVSNQKWKMLEGATM